MFHMIVVLPIWSQPLPGSVKEFFGGTRAYEYLLDFYGPKWMIIRILPIIISLLLGWNSKRHRYFLLITVLTIAFGIILTIIFVYPINDAIMAKAGEGSSPEEIKRMVDTCTIRQIEICSHICRIFLFIMGIPLADTFI